MENSDSKNGKTRQIHQYRGSTFDFYLLRGHDEQQVVEGQGAAGPDTVDDLLDGELRADRIDKVVPLGVFLAFLAVEERERERKCERAG